MSKQEISEFIKENLEIRIEHKNNYGSESLHVKLFWREDDSEKGYGQNRNPFLEDDISVSNLN